MIAAVRRVIRSNGGAALNDYPNVSPRCKTILVAVVRAVRANLAGPVWDAMANPPGIYGSGRLLISAEPLELATLHQHSPSLVDADPQAGVDESAIRDADGDKLTD